MRDAEAESGGFSAAEDAKLKETYMQLKERTPAEIRSFLPLHAQSDRSVDELVSRLGELGVISARVLKELTEAK